MPDAYKMERRFNDKGRCVEETYRVGAVVPVSFVMIFALCAGKALIDIPPSFWDIFKHLK